MPIKLDVPFEPPKWKDGLSPRECLVLYSVVAVGIVVVYIVQQVLERRKVLAEKNSSARNDGNASSCASLCSFIAGAPAQADGPEEEGLLKREDSFDLEGGDGMGSLVIVSPAKMAILCSEQGLKHGMEAAIFAVLLTLETRCRYGSPTMGVLRRGAAKNGIARAVEVELEASQISFAELIKLVDEAFQTTFAGGSGKPSTAPSEDLEVVLLWDEELSTTPAKGQWAVEQKQAIGGARHLAVRGPSAQEARSFKTLFEGLVANPEADVWNAPLLSDSALTHVQSWGMPAMDFQAYRDSNGQLRPVPHILKDMQIDPKALAIAGDDFTTTYTELWEQIGEVRKLVHANSNANSKHNGKKVVALYMGRGENIGPAFIGVLSAGYQVVPVDLHWPAERAKMVIEDSEASLVLLEQSSAVKWAELALPMAVEVPSVVVSASKLKYTGAASPIAELSQDSPAVMLFTSGSTGKPKGIMLSHGYLTSLVAGVADWKQMSKKTRTLCYHSPTWMPFLDYLFAPLIKGGCCLYFPEGSNHVVKPNDLKAFAQNHGATNAGFVPAMLDIFLEEGLPTAMNGIGVGGAAVPAEICFRGRAALPVGGRLYTGYSGTEQGDVTSVAMAVKEDVNCSVGDKGIMTAGRPHAGQQCMIVDQSFGPVCQGAVGEVVVAGPTLATGYLNLPDKTAETFLTSCKAMPNAQRVARSGDLAKWTSNGCLQVVGRRDSMVKVRGARIELGEVETAVASHPAVKDVVVTVHEDKLVAYVVPALPANLREHCKARLVGYMVPHIFEGLEVLPRLPNGKVNKKGLPKPQENPDGAEIVMELDSLGQMRKFTRRAASEDRVLDNVRAILIGLVIMAHSIPTPSAPGDFGMKDNLYNPIPHENFGPTQLFILRIVRGGGWSALAFLSGFDDTRGLKPYGLTYREPVFLLLWPLLGFNWTMWYLPAFVLMRVLFCAANWIGIERLYILLASQLWITVPAFVDFYIGWQTSDGSPLMDVPATCPSQCYCPWQAVPGLQKVSQYAIRWWVNDPIPDSSYVGHALIFIPCYWIGFYTGGTIFKVLTRVADEERWVLRVGIAGTALAVYMLMFSSGHPLISGFDDRCGSFYGSDGSFVFMQVIKNLIYYAMNLSMSLLYVFFIAAIVPVHLKYLAKICFSSLLMSPFTTVVLNFPAMAVEIRKLLPSSISSGIELLVFFAGPFIYELVSGAIAGVILPIVAKFFIGLHGMVKSAVCKKQAQVTEAVSKHREQKI